MLETVGGRCRGIGHQAAPASLAAERRSGALVSRLLDGGGAGIAAEDVRFVDGTRPMDT